MADRGDCRPANLPASLDLQEAAALRNLVSTTNPLSEHIAACLKYTTTLAVYQAEDKEAKVVSILEEGLKNTLDDLAYFKHLAATLSELAEEAQRQGGDIGRSIRERYEVRNTMYEDKRPIEKYGNVDEYVDFKSRVWAANDNGEDLPPMTHFFRTHDDGVEEEEEDLVMSYQGKRSMKCPITLMLFVEPVKSTRCPHVFTKTAITEMIQRSKGRKAVQCPVAGCDKILSADDLVPDKVMERRLEREGDSGDENAMEGEALSEDEAQNDFLRIDD